jgi:RNA polymerase sigma-70 factor (ECF subfamily)
VIRQSDPDTALVEGIRRGETAAFAEIYRRYRIPIHDYCIRMLRNSADAEDTVHETFLRMHNAIGTLSDPAAFRTWLFRIARNLVINSWRHGHAREYSDDDDYSASSSLENELIDREQQRTVKNLVEALRPSYRDVLVLREYEGLSYAEIASVVGITEDTVKVRLHRARKTLSRNYRSETHEEER